VQLRSDAFRATACPTEPVTFDALPGWRDDSHLAAYQTFLKTAFAIETATPPLRPALAPHLELRRLCHHTVQMKRPASDEDARLYFEHEFSPHRIVTESGHGFLTGYFEPELLGSLTQTPDFPTPVLARPHDLVTFSLNDVPASFAEQNMTAARLLPDGTLCPYFDRAMIEDGALADRDLVLLYVRDRVDLFFAQVQGSARIRLPDGSVQRLTYAGRNGHRYTTIARVIVAEGHMALSEVTLESLMAWLRAHTDDGERIMRMNASYIFFSLSDQLSSQDGPIGAAGTSLDAGRSIAIDRGLWCYGLPFFVAASLPDGRGGQENFRRMMVAQDTGSAILGPARVDLFMGSGAAAGHRAGLIRHAGDVFVLLPRTSA
jgi:membrane-bound lytic murein transglycosylase A